MRHSHYLIPSIEHDGIENNDTWTDVKETSLLQHMLRFIYIQGQIIKYKFIKFYHMFYEKFLSIYEDNSPHCCYNDHPYEIM